MSQYIQSLVVLRRYGSFGVADFGAIGGLMCEFLLVSGTDILTDPQRSVSMSDQIVQFCITCKPLIEGMDN